MKAQLAEAGKLTDPVDVDAEAERIADGDLKEIGQHFEPGRRSGGRPQRSPPAVRVSDHLPLGHEQETGKQSQLPVAGWSAARWS